MIDQVTSIGLKFKRGCPISNKIDFYQKFSRKEIIQFPRYLKGFIG